MSFILKIALRYFYTRKKNAAIALISGFSLIGVTIGVAALIVVMSVMNGFHRDLVKTMVGINGDITVNKYNHHIENYHSILRDLSKLHYIKNFLPIIESQVLIIHNDKVNGAIIRGIRKDDYSLKPQIFSSILHGNTKDIGQDYGVAIGHQLALTMGIKVGDYINIIVPNMLPTIVGKIPRSKSCKIVAVFSSGVYDYDAVGIVTDFADAQRLLSMKDSATKIEINLHDSNYVDDIKTALENILSEYDIESWIDRNAAFLNAIYTERITMFVILTLIVVVAAFNIISSLFMLVNDKVHDIAILRTIGVSRLGIMSIFMIVGSLIGLVGTIAGSLLGMYIAYNIEILRNIIEFLSNTKIFDASLYHLYNLPSDVILSDIVTTVCVSLLLCFISTIYPAYKAASLLPVDGLRHG